MTEYDNSTVDHHISLKEDNLLKNENFMKMINLPAFYSDIAELEGVVLTQGQGF